jgi:hypothetical protein
MDSHADTTLSDDEYTVLLIAAEGESMAPIGRWQAPVEHLVQLGYLHALDRHNNVITTEGRKAIGRREAIDNDALRGAAQAVTVAQSDARMCAEEAAQALVRAAQASVTVTGDGLPTAVQAWSQQVLRRAMELVRE